MIFDLIVVPLYCALPVLLVVGWVRWFRAGRSERRPVAISSLVGFALGNASALLAGVTILFAVLPGHFHTTRLLPIYKIGVGLSLTGGIAGLVGIVGRSALRWYAPALSLGMLFLWLVWAAGE